MIVNRSSLGPTAPLLEAVAEIVRQPVWVVGGTVRDVLLGAPGRDLDLALPSGSLDAARRLADRLSGAFVPLGEPHGMARVVLGGSASGGAPRTAGAQPLRRPEARGDLIIDLADFRGPTLEADLAGRDFTINALAVSVGDLVTGGRGEITDPTGGLGDLAARRLRACGPMAFVDDPIRVLRLLRLGPMLGFAIEPATEQWARAAVAALPAVAVERTRDELTRILGWPGSARILREAAAWSVIATLLPETTPMAATTQSAPHRFTVWEHSLRAVEALEALLDDLRLLAPHHERLAAHLGQSLGGGLTRREVLKLAVLLHDVAKPETRSVDPDGRIRFSGHDRLGAERVAAMAARLQWPGHAAQVLERLVRQHLRPMHLGMLAEISRRARYRFFRDVGEEVPDLVCLTIADAAATDGRPPAAVYRGATRELLDSLLAGEVEAAREAAAPPLVRGEDVMAAFGLPPGPAVGQLLRRAREAQALGLVRSRDEALAWLRRGDDRREG